MAHLAIDFCFLERPKSS